MTRKKNDFVVPLFSTYSILIKKAAFELSCAPGKLVSLMSQHLLTTCGLHGRCCELDGANFQFFTYSVSVWCFGTQFKYLCVLPFTSKRRKKKKEAVSLPTHLEATSSQTKIWSRLLCAYVGMWMWSSGWIQGCVRIKVYIIYLGFNLHKLSKL